jgi:hypothetical protein
MPLTGVTSEIDACATPGVARTASATCSYSAARGRRHAGPARVEPHEQHRVAIEAEIPCRERGERSNEQTRANDQHERERDLTHHNRIENARPAETAKDASAGALGHEAAVLAHRLHRFRT